ncbi:piccolo-like, partial [Tropilaelaps mercedesae]
MAMAGRRHRDMVTSSVPYVEPLMMSADFSPFTTDTEMTPSDSMATPAMPLLPDMPSRSRGLLENLGSVPLSSQHHMRSLLTDGSFQRGPRGCLGDPESSCFWATPYSGLLEERFHFDHSSRRYPVSTNFCNSNRNFDSVPNRASYRGVVTSSTGPATIRAHSAALNGFLRPIRGDLQRHQDTLQQPQHQATFLPHTKYLFPIKQILLTRDHPRDHSAPPNGEIGANGFGVEITGGRHCDDAFGGLAAFVTNVVNENSTKREVRVGDQVIEWNGALLQGRGADEVRQIIAHTYREPEVEVVLKSDSTNHILQSRSRTPQMHQTSSTFSSSRENLANEGRVSSEEAGSSAKPTASTPSLRNTQEPIRGKVMLQICHDSQARILYAGVLKARNLRHSGNDENDRSTLRPLNPYAQCTLMPDDKDRNTRRTRQILSVEPTWNQTMVYPNVGSEQLGSRYLVVSLWNVRSSTDEIEIAERHDPNINEIIWPNYGSQDNNDFIGE